MATHTIMSEDWRAGGEHVMVPRLRALQRHAEIEGGFQDDEAWFRLPEPLRSADWRALCVPARLPPGIIA